MAKRTKAGAPTVARNADLSTNSRKQTRITPPELHKPRLQFKWVDTISPQEWKNYRAAIQTMQKARIPFLLGGGFALAIYTGRWRDTKDIDFYVFKEHRQAAAEALAQAGFKDYFRTLPYDRKWIYRSTRSGVIVDIIWSMANQRAQVDEAWFRSARPVMVRGEPLCVVPIEEFMWCKLYILQRDHCDWTDVMNLLYAAADRIDWDHLLSRLEDDWPLLKALLTVYGWLCPKRSSALPATLRQRLNLAAPQIPRRMKRNRIRLLDSRNWFAALLPRDKHLDI